MVYIPYPRTDLDNNTDLAAWRQLTHKPANSWGQLKPFLAEQPRFAQIHRTPKCWYSELPQGDNYALDVEHFRPKNKAEPLSEKALKEIEKLTGFPILQETGSNPYPWLEFDYRNYRLVTAVTNRGGAKHIYFPLAKNSPKLQAGETPWQMPEYNLMLDPTDPHDATLLQVLPNGEIVPRAPKTVTYNIDYNNLAANWRSTGFNYLRAWVTIVMYRLNDRILVEAREEVYRKTTELIDHLCTCIKINAPEAASYPIRELAERILPSAPFALAARCAIAGYTIQPTLDILTTDNIKNTLNTIATRIDTLYAATAIDWNKP